MPDARIWRAAVSRSFMFHCIFDTFPTGQMENGERVVFKVTTSNRGIPYVRDSTSSVSRYLFSRLRPVICLPSLFSVHVAGQFEHKRV